ncbi:M48 family metallopeptidase [Roseicyclus sediminis]|uniref:M48 family metallopeptidase n=1 Tax=Roseicyclus sediminis TaxID=2980997 RepID=UPI0021CE19EE|nr:M48 family metallopeptidase [Roseibacterium sp. SDUM158016]
MRARLTPAILPLLAALLLSACVTTPVPRAPASVAEGARLPAISPQAFLAVAQEVEPVAEAVCRTETPDQNCDFAILVDRDPRVGANAFQTLDRQGRPVIILTLGLIAIFENEDELAFVLGHEAGHHIARHIPEQRRSAAEGARIFGEMAMAGGADAREIERAAELGAFVGARSYSRSAELEADAIGTVIAYRAGYDPLRGARLFSRLPEPEMRFLSTHPPNAERQGVVRRTLQSLGAGG